MRTSWILWGHWGTFWGPFQDHLSTWGLWGPEDFEILWLLTFLRIFSDLLRTDIWGFEDFGPLEDIENVWDLFEDLLMNWGLWGETFWEHLLRTLRTFWGFEDFVDPLRTLMTLMTFWGLFKELSTLGTFWRLSEHLEDLEALLRTFWVTFEDFLRIFSGPFLELWTWEPVDFELFLRTF